LTCNNLIFSWRINAFDVGFLSAWRDVDSKKERFEGRSTVFDEIFSEIKSIRSDSELIYDSYDGAAKSKKNTTKSLFQFFAGTPKFQKSLKR